MDLTALTARLNELGGFDLTDAEACDLLNEGIRAAARRSRYPRKLVELGPAVAEQTAYSLPTDFLLPTAVAVAGKPWEQSDLDTVRQIEKGQLTLQATGVWYEAPDSEGARKLYLYPAPSGGETLELEYVYEPTALNVDEPSKSPDAFPTFWHPKLRYFAAEVYYETVEDNAELAEVQKAKAEAAIGDLLRYENERGGGGSPFMVRIAGVTG